MVFLDEIRDKFDDAFTVKALPGNRVEVSIEMGARQHLSTKEIEEANGDAVTDMCQETLAFALLDGARSLIEDIGAGPDIKPIFEQTTGDLIAELKNRAQFKDDLEERRSILRLLVHAESEIPVDKRGEEH